MRQADIRDGATYTDGRTRRKVVDVCGSMLSWQDHNHIVPITILDDEIALFARWAKEEVTDDTK